MKFLRISRQRYRSEDGRYEVWVDAKIRHGRTYELEWGARHTFGAFLGYPGYANKRDAIAACNADAESEKQYLPKLATCSKCGAVSITRHRKDCIP